MAPIFAIIRYALLETFFCIPILPKTGENKNLYYYNIKNDIYIKSSKELENNIVNEIGQSDIPFIFDMLKFNQITNDTGEIYFVEGFDLAIAQGLVYTPDGEKPANMYIIELEKVDNNWFFFKER